MQLKARKCLKPLWICTITDGDKSTMFVKVNGMGIDCDPMGIGHLAMQCEKGQFWIIYLLHKKAESTIFPKNHHRAIFNPSYIARKVSPVSPMSPFPLSPAAHPPYIFHLTPIPNPVDRALHFSLRAFIVGDEANVQWKQINAKSVIKVKQASSKAWRL